MLGLGIHGLSQGGSSLAKPLAFGSLRVAAFAGGAACAGAGSCSGCEGLETPASNVEVLHPRMIEASHYGIVVEELCAF